MLQHLFGNKKGISIIELLVAVAIISFALISLLELTSFCLRITSIINQTNKANNMAQEMMEQIRNFRDVTSWNVDGLETITPGTDYYIQESGSYSNISRYVRVKSVLTPTPKYFDSGLAK